MTVEVCNFFLYALEAYYLETHFIGATSPLLRLLSNI